MKNVLIASGLAVTFAVLVPVWAAGAQQPSTVTAPSAAASPRAVLDRYCITCHNKTLKTAGLALDTLDLSNVAANGEVWEKAVRKLRAGVMPPAGRPRPDQATYEGLVSWLETALDAAAAAHPHPGRTEPFHRLNRAEYQNAIRDLLELDVDVSSLLPTDDSSYGFDNMAGVLKMSPTLMERYLSAAQKISRMVMGTPALIPNVDTFRVQEDLAQDDRLDGQSFGTRGGTKIHYRFPMDADYVIRVRLARLGLSGGATEDIPRFAESHQLEVSVDGNRAQLFTLVGEQAPQGKKVDQYQQDRKDLDAGWQVRLPIKAGSRDVAVAFVKRSSALDETVRLPFLRPFAGSGGDLRYEPYLSSVTISGPFDATGAGDTASRRRLLVCQPANGAPSGEEAGCARTILSTVARRAYRRPITDADLKPLLAFYEEGRGEGGFERGIEMGLQRLLVSPSFLFRIENDPVNLPADSNYHVTDLELASRLSFFLWSSIPDDELLDLATRGRLREPAVLEQQVRRMLADARSDALARNFAGQWLFLRNLPALSPDVEAFPDFDHGLRTALQRETELFFASILRENHNVLDLLNADYTFVNERLARHYGIPNVRGSHFRRITLTDDNRRGLLGQGSVLAATAYPNRTSPVLRGKWVLENILGTPPPPPPPNVPSLKDTNASGHVLSMRERMAQHRNNAVCASCHSMMDPPGFSLENFDAIGRQRTVDERFAPIDASGVLPDGTRFEGPAGLRQALLDHPDLFVTTLSEKLLTYALGRGLAYYDQPAVRQIVRDAGRDDYRFTSIIMNIVNSSPFQMRRSRS
jgi:mono/diheme cytochrome c family protein